MNEMMKVDVMIMKVDVDEIVEVDEIHTYTL